MTESPSAEVMAIPEILSMVIDFFDTPTLKTASLVCRNWHRHTRLILWRQLVIPKDWYDLDLAPLWPILDREGSAIKALSLELSNAAKMKQELDLNLIRNQLAGLLSRIPNLESLNVQLPREIKSDIMGTVAEHATQLKQFETDILDWNASDMTTLLAACPELRQIAGHNFTGQVLQAIARTQPTLNRIDCTHPRFDDEELIAFAEQFPDLLQLSVSLHQFLTSKALIGVAQYCHKIEHLGFHFCLCLQSSGFQAIFEVSPNLQFLDLGPSEVDDADITLLAAQCPLLESLKLPFCANITHTSISAIVQSCKHLRHLDLSWCDKVLLSIFNMETPWVCEGLRYLDISGIHASYSVEASMASSLLPSMYHQLSLLRQLRHLKLSGHGFALGLLNVGRPYLSELRDLESLDVEKLKNPLPWKDMIDIGNLFPKLKEFKFRSNDVIPPQSASERAAIRSATQGHAWSRAFTREQPQPGEAHEVRPSTWTAVLSSSASTSTTAGAITSTIAGPSDTSTEARSPKRRRSRSPSPEASGQGSTSCNAASEKVEQEKARADKDEDESIAPVMKATLRSGLEISFRVSGEDEEGGPDGEEGWVFPPGMSFYD